MDACGGMAAYTVCSIIPSELENPVVDGFFVSEPVSHRTQEIIFFAVIGKVVPMKWVLFDLFLKMKSVILQIILNITFF